MGGFTAWDILGVIILLGPLIVTVLSLTSAFIYTGYLELFKRPPRYSARSIGLISVSLGVIMVTGVGYTFLRPIYFQPQIAPSSVLTIDGDIEFKVSWDPDGRIEVVEIDWGTLRPGETVEKTIYIINQASGPIYYSIAWNESSWFPIDAAQFFDLGSNSSEESIQPDQSLPVLIELSVSPGISGIRSFSFDIIVKVSTEPFS